MCDATQAAIQFAVREHARCGFITDPERLAAAWAVRIVPGSENRASSGPPSIITLCREHYAPRQRFTIHHELAHIAIQRSQLEDDIMAEVDPDDAEHHLELVANHIAGMLVMPDPMVRAALQMFGQHPETIVTLQQIAQVSLGAAMRRFTAAQPEPLTAFMTSGTFVQDVASSDPYNRLTRYQRLPDARAALPDAALLALPGEARLLGVVGW